MSPSGQPEEFSVQQDVREDGVVVVSVRGEVDLFTAPQLGAVLDGLARAKRATVLDLARVEFMSSTGLTTLIRAARESRRDGWSFAIRDELPEHVDRVFELMALRPKLPFETP
jgi:anti-sigma B factor antagonist